MMMNAFKQTKVLNQEFDSGFMRGLGLCIILPYMKNPVTEGNFYQHFFEYLHTFARILV